MRLQYIPDDYNNAIGKGNLGTSFAWTSIMFRIIYGPIFNLMGIELLY